MCGEPRAEYLLTVLRVSSLFSVNMSSLLFFLLFAVVFYELGWLSGHATAVQVSAGKPWLHPLGISSPLYVWLCWVTASALFLLSVTSSLCVQVFSDIHCCHHYAAF